MRTLVTAFALAFLIAPALPASDCEVYWFYRWGKEDPEYLRVSGSWALIHFTRNKPYWYYGPRDELTWRPAAPGASIRALQGLGGLRVYEVSYSPLSRVIVWDQGDWSFCPALIASGDESIVGAIDEAEVFRWQGTDIAHVRVQYKGTGHFQESLFFAPVEGVLTHLEWSDAGQELVTEFYRTHSLEPFHRGLGFCAGRLVEQRLVSPGGVVEIEYRVDGRRLVATHVDFGKIDEAKCRIFAAP